MGQRIGQAGKGHERGKGGHGGHGGHGGIRRIIIRSIIGGKGLQAWVRRRTMERSLRL